MVLVKIALFPKFVGIKDLEFRPPEMSSQIHRRAKEQRRRHLVGKNIALAMHILHKVPEEGIV